MKSNKQIDMEKRKKISDWFLSQFFDFGKCLINIKKN